jgi:hypothetical protein
MQKWLRNSVVRRDENRSNTSGIARIFNAAGRQKSQPILCELLIHHASVVQR